jgi:2-hydroxychromene-2-carboxylate isomerase
MQIEIWSDVVCPWCYIGKRRLERALGEFEHADEVEVTWRSFQLNPDAPATAVPTLDYLAQRFGPQAQAMTARVAELGKGEGLTLDFASSLTVNTLEAHRMLHLAADLGIGDAAKERLLRAHFTEGDRVRGRGAGRHRHGQAAGRERRAVLRHRPEVRRLRRPGPRDVPARAAHRLRRRGGRRSSIALAVKVGPCSS